MISNNNSSNNNSNCDGGNGQSSEPRLSNRYGSPNFAMDRSMLPSVFNGPQSMTSSNSLSISASTAVMPGLEAIRMMDNASSSVQPSQSRSSSATPTRLNRSLPSMSLLLTKIGQPSPSMSPSQVPQVPPVSPVLSEQPVLPASPILQTHSKEGDVALTPNINQLQKQTTQQNEETAASSPSEQDTSECTQAKKDSEDQLQKVTNGSNEYTDESATSIESFIQGLQQKQQQQQKQKEQQLANFLNIFTGNTNQLTLPSALLGTATMNPFASVEQQQQAVPTLQPSLLQMINQPGIDPAQAPLQTAQPALTQKSSLPQLNTMLTTGAFPFGSLGAAANPDTSSYTAGSNNTQMMGQVPIYNLTMPTTSTSGLGQSIFAATSILDTDAHTDRPLTTTTNTTTTTATATNRTELQAGPASQIPQLQQRSFSQFTQLQIPIESMTAPLRSALSYQMRDSFEVPDVNCIMTRNILAASSQLSPTNVMASQSTTHGQQQQQQQHQQQYPITPGLITSSFMPPLLISPYTHQSSSISPNWPISSYTNDYMLTNNSGMSQRAVNKTKSKLRRVGRFYVIFPKSCRTGIFTQKHIL
ncbi:hypothetical protein GQ42DRAFT_5637 [Ramicandelaber brevisporus]|nr:hypothetical protein GQ42DRAFT_5637 [Ramicandelaber brevisporus]